MKIAFHINSLGLGGAERVVTNLANSFAKDGFEVVIATEWTADEEYVLDDSVKRVHVGLKKSDEKKTRAVKFIKRVQYLHDFMKTEKPDVLIAFMHRSIYRALMAEINTKVPVIISVRNDPKKDFVAFTDKLQTFLLMGKAKGAVFQTKEAQSFFGQNLQKKSTIILNPLNDKYIGLPFPEKRTKRVVNVARIAAQKNHLLLIDAFEKVHEKHPEVVLEIYGPDGDDDMPVKVRERLEKGNLKDYIKLMGASSTLEKDIIDASVFAYSSDYEGMPNGVMEAMAMGLPVVCTDCPCGGPRTLIKNKENGLLVPVGDANALADGINFMLDNPDKADRMGQEAKKLCEIANSDVVYKKWKDYVFSRVNG